MTTKTKPHAKSRILDAVRETATDLHRLGFIDKRKKPIQSALKPRPAPHPKNA